MIFKKLFQPTEQTAPEIPLKQEAYRQAKAQLTELQTQRESLYKQVEARRRENKAALARGQFALVDSRGLSDLNLQLEALDLVIRETESRVANLRNAWRKATDPTLKAGEKKGPPSWGAGLPLQPKSGTGKNRGDTW